MFKLKMLCYLDRNDSSLMCRLIILQTGYLRTMKRIKPMLPAIGIFCFALIVRVIYNNTVAYHYYPLHDSAFYQGIAFHLLNEHCFCLESYVPTVYRPPLWPFTIAGISLIFGPSDYFARLFLSLVGSGTCVLVYLFAIFMMAGSIQNPSTFFCFLLFAMGCIVYSTHQRETGETG